MMKLKASTPQDLMKIIPTVLGFHPENSIVMVVTGGPRQFQARIDLPGSQDEARLASEALLEPCKEHGATDVIFVAYADGMPMERLDVVVGIAEFCNLVKEWPVEVLDFILATSTDGGWGSLMSGETGTQPSQDEIRAYGIEHGAEITENRDALFDQIRIDLEFGYEVLTKVGSAPAARDVKHLWDLSAFPPPDAITAATAAISAMKMQEELIESWVYGDLAQERLSFWLAVCRGIQAETARNACLRIAGHAAWAAGHGALGWVCWDSITRKTDQDEVLKRKLEGGIAPPLSGCAEGA